MSEDTKGNTPSTPPPDKPATERPAAAGENKPPAVKADEQVAPGKSGDVKAGSDPAAVKPAPPAKPAAPAAAAAAPKPPAAPPKPAGPTPQPWEAEMVANLKRRFGSGIKEASTYVGQKYMVVDLSVVHDVLGILRDEDQFDYCVDITAVHYPKREQQFDIVWILYSFPQNERIRVKTLVKDGDPVPSAVDLWPTADWLERECFDMFGIKFEGHPGLKRILLPDAWKGHPLRKEYGILQQDVDWVKANLHIESGQ